MQMESIDEELGNYFRQRAAVVENDENQTLKLSQLRQLLEKNLQPTISPTNSAFKPTIKPEPPGGSWPPFPVSAANVGQTSNSGITNVPNNDQDNVPTSSNNNSLSSRRRVSFNPLIVQDTGTSIGVSGGSHGVHVPICTVGSGGGVATNTTIVGNNSSNGSAGTGSSGSGGVSSYTSVGIPGNGNLQPGQSPGTRKRHFSFQPISPRQGSLPQSPSASPFISPRSTPVPSIRSRHSSGSALPLHLLPQGSTPGGVGGVVIGPGGAVVSVGQKIPNFNSSSSDISRAATFGSASESSTPFISPHGTPIPFNRSRHNSAQGRLCRSRHSSGLAPYRYNIQTFSPMALNNLNNPYSPQPATPVGTVVEDMFCGPTSYTMTTGEAMGNGGMVVATMSGPVGNTGQPCIIVQNDNRSRHSSANSCDMNNTHSAPMSPHCGMTPGIKDVMIQDPSSQVYDINQQPDIKRHRHASAGSAPDRQTYRPSDWMGAPPPLASQPVTLLRQDQPQEVQQIHVQTDLRSQTVPLNSFVESSANALQIEDGVNLPGNEHALSSYPMSGGVNPSFGTSEIDFMNTTGVETSTQSGMATGNVSPDDTRSGSGRDNGEAPDNGVGGVHGSGEGQQDDLDETLSALKECDNSFSTFIQESENVGM